MLFEDPLEEYRIESSENRETHEYNQAQSDRGELVNEECQNAGNNDVHDGDRQIGYCDEYCILHELLER